MDKWVSMQFMDRGEQGLPGDIVYILPCYSFVPALAASRQCDGPRARDLPPALKVHSYLVEYLMITLSIFAVLQGHGWKDVLYSTVL